VSEEKFTLSFIYDVKPEYKKYVDEVLVPKWRETYPGGSVEFTPVPWNNLDEVLMTSKAAGAMPDLFVLGAQMAPIAAKNKLSLPLDDRLAEWADVPDFFDFCWETAQWDGQTWAVPTCMAPRDWCYRKDLTDEAGVTISDDWTFDDYLAAEPKLTVVENGKLVRMGSTADNHGLEFLGVLYSAKGALLKNGKAAFNNEAGIWAVNWIKQRNNAAAPTGVAPLPESPIPYFATGQVVIAWYVSCYYWNLLRQYAPDKIDYWVLPQPPLKKRRIILTLPLSWALHPQQSTQMRRGTSSSCTVRSTV
jgi:ABC-type glycerol-3-phosphate transport system substrate-binding protein